MDEYFYSIVRNDNASSGSREAVQHKNRADNAGNAGNAGNEGNADNAGKSGRADHAGHATFRRRGKSADGSHIRTSDSDLAQGWYQFGTGVTTGSSQMARKDTRKAVSSRKWWLILAIVLMCLLFGMFVVLPRFLVIERFEISGTSMIGAQEVLTLASLGGRTSWVTLDCAKIKAAIETDSRVDTARVTKVFPKTLAIGVTERVPIAYSIAEIDGVQRVVLIDKNGIVFSSPHPAEPLKLSESDLMKLPMVSGLYFADFKPGVHLPEMIMPLLTSLSALPAHSDLLLSAFSEIRLMKDADGKIDAVMYPMNAAPRVRCPLAFDAQMLKSVLLVLDVVNKRGMSSSISEINFTGGTVTYITQGETPG